VYDTSDVRDAIDGKTSVIDESERFDKSDKSGKVSGKVTILSCLTQLYATFIYNVFYRKIYPTIKSVHL